MNKLLLILIILVIVFGIIYVVFLFSGPKKKDFNHLVEPRIVKKENVRALVADFDGDFNNVLKEAFGKLFKKYFSLKDVPKGPKMPATFARYENFDKNLELTQENIKDMPWKGYVAIPIDDVIEVSDGGGVKVKTVDYGLVAEIVHFGAYDKETENINKLKKFIEDEGYEISGLHEEEYIKGPGWLYRPKSSYITIIRYQVKKK